MKIPTLTDNYLYLANRHRQHWLRELDKRKTLRYCVALFTVIAIGVFAWVIRP